MNVLSITGEHGPPANQAARHRERGLEDGEAERNRVHAKRFGSARHAEIADRNCGCHPVGFAVEPAPTFRRFGHFREPGLVQNLIEITEVKRGPVLSIAKNPIWDASQDAFIRAYLRSSSLL